MNRSVLYVEDEEDYRFLVRRILERVNIRVRVAETGAEAFQMLKEERPGAVLLDVNLPDTTGHDICARLRQDPTWEDLPIVMLTVKRLPDEWLEGFSYGATDYVAKPLHPGDLIERVERAFESPELAPAIPNAEKRLIRAAARGNRAAFEVLVQKYKRRLAESLSSSIRQEEQLEDIMSQAFVTALEHLGEFRGDASFFTWLYRIAMNKFIVSSRRPVALPLEDISERQETRLLAPSMARPVDEDFLTDQQSYDRTLESMQRVPQPYRKVLELYCLREMSYEKISRRLRIPEGTVMSRLHKARKILQERLAMGPAARRA